MQDVKYSTMFIVGTQMARAIMIAAAALTFRTVKSIVIAAMITQLLSIILLFWYLDERFPRFWTHFEWEFLQGTTGLRLALRRLRHAVGDSERPGQLLRQRDTRPEGLCDLRHRLGGRAAADAWRWSRSSR